MKLLLIISFAFMDIWRVPNDNGKPLSIPEGKFAGVHSDSASFYFFTDAKEHEDFLNNLPKLPVLEAAKSDRQLIDSLFSEISNVKKSVDTLKIKN